jgi:hypothetical protein
MSCAPTSYDLNATKTMGTGTLDSSSGLTFTKTGSAVKITMALLSNGYVGVYDGKLTYKWSEGKALTLSFKITVTPCVLSSISLGAAWPEVIDFRIGLT